MGLLGHHLVARFGEQASEEDGQDAVRKNTVKNSPLPVDAIGYHPISGEGRP
jgi:hypothetical protein